MKIPIKSAKEVRKMQIGGQKLAGYLQQVISQAKVGMKLIELEELANKLIENNQGKSPKKISQPDERIWPAVTTAENRKGQAHIGIEAFFAPASRKTGRKHGINRIFGRSFSDWAGYGDYFWFIFFEY